MSAPPDPPPPPDPRERLPEDGSPAAFVVRHSYDFVLGLAFAVLPALGLFALAVHPRQFEGSSALGAALMLAFGLSYMASPFLVRRITVADDRLFFEPVGLELAMKDVATIEWARGDAQQGLVIGIGLTMRPRKLRWLPGRLLWVGRRCSLRLIGMDGAALHAALSNAIGSRPRAISP